MTGITFSPASATVYQTVTGTVTVNDGDTTKLFVDWGDGTDRTVENGINQWGDIEKPTAAHTITHIYTQTGTFSPIVRTVNNQGFVSKYYGSASTNSDLAPYESVGARINGITISDGKPASIVKTESKKVLSGIDNNIFKDGPRDVYLTVAPPVSDGSGLLDNNFKFEIKAETAQSSALVATLSGANIYETLLNTYEVSTSINDGNNNRPLNIIASGGATPDTTSLKPGIQTPLLTRISKILEVKLKNPKIVGASNATITELNQLKFFLVAKSSETDDVSTADYYPITYVSAGDPIKKWKDNRRTVTFDFGQSRAKASNTLINAYKFDNGKGFFQKNSQWQASSSTDFTNTNKSSQSLIKEGYTYMVRPDGLLGSGNTLNQGMGDGAQKARALNASGNSWIYSGSETEMDLVRDQFLMTEFNQFAPFDSLVRLTSLTDSSQISNLDTFKGVYRITPTTYPGGSGALIDKRAARDGRTSIQTTNAYYNTNSYPINVDGWNSMGFDNLGLSIGEENPRLASEYMIVTNETKFNKIFINNTPYSKEMMTNLSGNISGSQLAGVFYLKVYNEIYGDYVTQKAKWEPLEFRDTTTFEKEFRDPNYIANSTDAYNKRHDALVKPGYIEFDMPSDWAQTSVTALTAGLFNSGAAAISGSTIYSISSAAHIAGSSSQGGGTYVIDISSTAYTPTQIGGYKYVWQSTATPYNNNIGWVVSSNTNVTSPPGTRLYVKYGDTATAPALQSASGWLRRINLYEMIDGAWPLGSAGSTANIPNALSGVPYDFTFMISTSAFRTEFVDNFTGVYPLKLVWQGNSDAVGSYLPAAYGLAGHFPRPFAEPYASYPASTSAVTGLEMWDMYPFNNAFSTIITQTDNTAYDLNYIALTNDINVTYAGTFYQAITKGGRVYVVRTGTPIQTINFGGTAMGDESSFSFSDTYTSFYTLKKLQTAQAERIRVMWDEQQKDGTFVRFFGFVTNVAETHKITGKRATRPFTFAMVIEEICLIDKSGNLISEIEPLGGVSDARKFS